MIFYRGDDVVNTTYLPWGNLVYYLCMNIIGHWYVNVSNLNFYRKNICKTNSNRWLDFLLLPLFAPILFILSSIIVLRADTDIASTGDDDYRYPWWNCFMFNAFAWQIAYFIGLQFTHFDKGPMVHFVLTPDKIKKWPKILFVISGVILILALAILGYMIYAYWISGMFFYYLAWCFIIMAIFGLITCCVRKTHKVHMHHYTVGMIVILTIGYQSIPAAIVHAFCNGMMIEGGSRWGYDPVWIRKHPQENKEE